MESPSTLHSQPYSKPSRRSRRVEEGEELEKKPKKVNSEVRKQQNRIASRNYRTSYPAVVSDWKCRANVCSFTQVRSGNASYSIFNSLSRTGQTTSRLQTHRLDSAKHTSAHSQATTTPDRVRRTCSPRTANMCQSAQTKLSQWIQLQQQPQRPSTITSCQLHRHIHHTLLPGTVRFTILPRQRT